MSEPARTSAPDPDDATRTTPGAVAGGGYTIAAPDGYELLGEIGSGGMGVVFRARDLDLAREVAVKILRPQYSPDSPTARRFLDEARITGRLQHPYIPAIYRVGTLPDGRPFLAMKLIGGRTLDELLKAPNEAPADRGQSLTPFEQAAHGMLDRLDEVLRRGRFLAVFEHVAQAIAYAHRQGVIHRDLKPSNVMVGRFGEVQVLDWGIAKSGDRRQETGVGEAGPAATVDYAPGSPLATPQSDLTQAGAILGTPAFMPPEQAIGAIDQIGRHSDVFGLGAILCVILTGKPPYVAEDAESNRRLAARGKLDDCFARLDASGAEPELVALAKRCLAPEPKDRPRDAGEVARAVAALRADAERRARDAEMDRAREEVQLTEERKRRRVKRALAAAVLGLVALAGVAGWWVDRERSRHAADEREATLRREADEKDRQLAYEREVMSNVNEVHRLLTEGAFQDENLDRWLVYLSNAGGTLRRANNLLDLGRAAGLAPARGDQGGERVGPGQPRPPAARRTRPHCRQQRNAVPDARLVLQRHGAAVRGRVPRARYRPLGRADGRGGRVAEETPIPRPTLVRDPRVAAVLPDVGSRRGHRRPGDGGGRGIDRGRRVSGGSRVRARPEPAVREVAAGEQPPREAERDTQGRDGQRLREGLVGRRGEEGCREARVPHPAAGVRPPDARELSSLADGLTPATPTKCSAKLLAIAYDRFPGEFWVHFRLAFHSRFALKPPGPNDRRS